MGITYASGTVTVTGGTQDNPYSMADLAASGTSSSYIETGGYDGKVYTMTGADLVIGSTAGDTYFDLTNSIIDTKPGQYLTLYSSALRGGKMGGTWGSRVFSNVKPATDTDKAKCINMAKKVYLADSTVMDPRSGVWISSPLGNVIVAVMTDDSILNL